jgi:hypothetical protein
MITFILIVYKDLCKNVIFKRYFNSKNGSVHTFYINSGWDKSSSNQNSENSNDEESFLFDEH